MLFCAAQACREGAVSLWACRLVMGVRCGDIDPAVVTHLQSNHGWSTQELIKVCQAPCQADQHAIRAPEHSGGGLLGCPGQCHMKPAAAVTMGLCLLVCMMPLQHSLAWHAYACHSGASYVLKQHMKV